MKDSGGMDTLVSECHDCLTTCDAAPELTLDVIDRNNVQVTSCRY